MKSKFSRKLNDNPVCQALQKQTRQSIYVQVQVHIVTIERVVAVD